MKTLLLLGLMTVTFNTFAGEVCNVGYNCETTANGENILRLTTLVQDESLQVCQVVTIANFGANAEECASMALEANKTLN